MATKSKVKGDLSRNSGEFLDESSRALGAEGVQLGLWGVHQTQGVRWVYLNITDMDVLNALSSAGLVDMRVANEMFVHGIPETIGSGFKSLAAELSSNRVVSYIHESLGWCLVIVEED